MLKRSLRISGYNRAEERRAEVQKSFKKNNFFHSVATALLLYCSSALFLIVSCAPKYVELPSYEGIPIENAISELKSIQSIEAVLFVEYEKNDSIMSGDASLLISENNLDLKLYYLGFLVGEVKEEDGIIKSNPKLDKNKSAILVDGLKNSFFWWNMSDYALQEKEDFYELKNSYRKIFLNKKTALPVQQIVELHDGEKLNIFYDIPVKYNSELEKTEKPLSGINHSSPLLWYNSALRIEFKNYIVRIKVKSYSVR